MHHKIAASNQARTEWIDIGKGIAMICVIYGHLAQREQLSRIVVYSCHMPFFLMVSGFLSKKRDIRQTIRSGMRKLVIPAVLALMVDVVVYLIEMLFFPKSLPSSVDWVKVVLFMPNKVWFNQPIWYLLSLFLCTVIHQFIKADRSRMIAMAIIVCVFATGINERYFPAWFPVASISAFLFYEVGYFLQKHLKDLAPLANRKGILGCLAGVALWVAISAYNGYTDIYIQENGRNFLLFLAAAILGSACVARFSRYLVSSKLGNSLKLIGRNSMVILSTHYYLCRKLIPFFESSIGYHFEGYAFTLYVFVVTAMISVMYYGIFRIKGGG